MGGWSSRARWKETWETVSRKGLRRRNLLNGTSQSKDKTVNMTKIRWTQGTSDDLTGHCTRPFSEEEPEKRLKYSEEDVIYTRWHETVKMLYCLSFVSAKINSSEVMLAVNSRDTYCFLMSYFPRSYLKCPGRAESHFFV